MEREEIIEALQCCRNGTEEDIQCDMCPLLGDGCSKLNEQASEMLKDDAAEIARLKAENEKLRGERDAAAEDIPHECYYCGNFVPGKKAVCKCGCEITPLSIYPHEKCRWEWRGPQKGGKK